MALIVYDINYKGGIDMEIELLQEIADHLDTIVTLLLLLMAQIALYFVIGAWKGKA